MSPETITPELRDEFYRIWDKEIRPFMPSNNKRELQAAQHAAWLAFKTIKAPKNETTTKPTA